MAFHRPFKNPFRRAFRYATRMQYGLRRPRKVNDLRLACRYVAKLIHWHERMIREDPEIFDPRCIRERQEAEARELKLREYDAMIRRIYSESEFERGSKAFQKRSNSFSCTTERA